MNGLVEAGGSAVTHHNKAFILQPPHRPGFIAFDPAPAALSQVHVFELSGQRLSPYKGKKPYFDPLILTFSLREKGLSILNLTAMAQSMGTLDRSYF